jgi:hypothetical protein
MLAVARVLLAGTMELGVISIAATLWLELRRDDRRRRIVKTVEAVLNGDEGRPSGGTPLKRAA